MRSFERLRFFLIGPPRIMAIPHFRASFIGSTKSPVAAAAYRHRTAMMDDSTGARWAYRNDGDLVHSEFVIPQGSPAWLVAIHELETNSAKSSALWNKAILAERQINGQTAREFVIALPNELSRDENIALMRSFVETQFSSRGLVVDWVLHDKPGNPHVHLMHTLRPLTATGFGPKKIALRDEAGEPVRAPSGKIVYRDFIGNRDTLIDLRTAWAQTASRHLALAGQDVHLDLSSFASRGIRLTPSRHIGPAGAGIGRDGRASDAVAATAADKAITAAQIDSDPGRIIDLVSQQSSVFDQRDIARALHRFIDEPGAFANAYARALRHPSLVQLAPEVSDAVGRLERPAKLATKAMIELESAMAQQAAVLASARRHALSAGHVTAALSRSPVRLSEQQAAAVIHITEGADLACIVGFAGAGKSTLLADAREAWRGSHVVVGAALAGKAASGLQSASGIPSRTIASWTHAWDRGRDQLTPRHVFVLDEAGMVSSSDMAAIVAEVARAGAKLVLVGDPEQLQPIQAGGAFRALVEQAGAFELAGVRRQNEPWARDASVAFQRGNIAAALAAYATHDSIHFKADRLAAATALVDAYMGALVSGTASAQIALAHRNDDVLALNTAIQHRLCARGELGPAVTVSTTHGGRSVATGDRLLFLKNGKLPAVGDHPATRVTNGLLGTVTSVSSHDSSTVLVVATDDGQSVAFDPASYPDFDLGYATTIHKSQGATVDRAFILASPTMDKHLAYVAMTRHRQSAQLYVPAADIADMGRLISTFSRANPKATTLDYAERRSIQPAPAVRLDLVPLLTTAAKALVTSIRERFDTLYFDLHLRVSQSRVSWYPRPDDHQPNTGSKIMDTPTSSRSSSQPAISVATVGNRVHASWIKDTEANSIARAAGAKWSSEHTAWVFDPKNALTDRALADIDARITDVQASRLVAANFRHDSASINTTIADGKLVVKSPKDPGTNAMLRDAGGEWSKRLGGYTFELPNADAALALKSALTKIDQYVADIVPVREMVDRTNRELPGINFTATLNRSGAFDFAVRPPYDKQILTILKSEPNPASWDPASKSWKLSATPDNAVALDAKLVDVFSRVTDLKVAQGVAQDFTSMETHPLIVVTAKGHNIIVAMPDDNNAGQALNRAGFSWQPALKAYAGVPDDEDQAERMAAAIASAGRHLDRAILPHTPERDGIPHLNSFSVKVLHDAQENTAQRYGAEPNVRRFVDKIVDRYNAFSDEQKAAVQFKDAKAFGDITGVDHAKAGIAMNIVEAALRVQDQGRALVQAQTAQSLTQTRTQAPSQSM